jgi:hypothetical protein
MEEYRKEKPRRFTPRRNVDKGKEIKTAWDRLCIVGRMKHVARRGAARCRLRAAEMRFQNSLQFSDITEVRV